MLTRFRNIPSIHSKVMLFSQRENPSVIQSSRKIGSVTMDDNSVHCF